ncbi:hypothetical protein ACM25P_20215 [Vreelandella alkaliphila]|uniref:hypothetical protein n=1 Tax=Vreelandella alkaliphila TaxID=272774 RepID=UPI0039F5275F
MQRKLIELALQLCQSHYTGQTVKMPIMSVSELGQLAKAWRHVMAIEEYQHEHRGNPHPTRNAAPLPRLAAS